MWFDTHLGTIDSIDTDECMLTFVFPQRSKSTSNISGGAFCLKENRPIKKTQHKHCLIIAEPDVVGLSIDSKTEASIVTSRES
jgi:hypothetical protein